MRRAHSALPILASGLVGLSLFACAPGDQATGVLAANDALVLAWADKDVDRVVEFYADEGALIPPHSEPVTGKESIRHFVHEFFASPNATVRAEGLRADVSSSGDLAYVLGRYEAQFSGPGDAVLTDRGPDLHVWKKQADGSWKVVIDMWSSDLPFSADQ